MAGSRLRILFLLSLSLLIGGCGTMGQRPQKQGPVAIQYPAESLSERELLDVWIEVFDPGRVDQERDKKVGISPEIRKAESRFIPVQLKKTLQRTGHWGAVRVVPENSLGGELIVSGKILASDGELLTLQIVARDSTGQQWLDKTYQGVADPAGYRDTSQGNYDAFQDTYNRIANDLAKIKQRLSAGELDSIRRVAELKFAADLAPRPFEGYLQSENGRQSVRRLPARDDPMMQRVLTIRERDYLFIDTINDHYDDYYRNLREPYGNWRRYNQEEIEYLREVEREAMTRKVLGIGAIVGAIALGMSNNHNSEINTSTLSQAMLLGGLMVAKSGFDKDSEKQIHVDAMQELGDSFESEANPMVVEVDDETHQLTGSVETQYAKWRDLLHRIYLSETGLTDRSID
jgi:hypothetical protein